MTTRRQRPRKTKLRSYTFDAPAHWATCLINGDLSGLDYSGQHAVDEYEKWCKSHKDECRDVVGVKGDVDEPWIGRFNGLQTEMLTYTALAHDSVPLSKLRAT